MLFEPRNKLAIRNQHFSSNPPLVCSLFHPIFSISWANSCIQKIQFLRLRASANSLSFCQVLPRCPISRLTSIPFSFPHLLQSILVLLPNSEEFHIPTDYTPYHIPLFLPRPSLRILTRMAGITKNKKILALFDVDGTLTVARKVNRCFITLTGCYHMHHSHVVLRRRSPRR